MRIKEKTVYYIEDKPFNIGPFDSREEARKRIEHEIEQDINWSVYKEHETSCGGLCGPPINGMIYGCEKCDFVYGLDGGHLHIINDGKEVKDVL
jgi:hypothetical protein